MEKSLHLNTTHRAAWMACGFIVLAAATLTFSDSVNAAAVVVVENKRVQSPSVVTVRPAPLLTSPIFQDSVKIFS